MTVQNEAVVEGKIAVVEHTGVPLLRSCVRKIILVDWHDDGQSSRHTQWNVTVRYKRNVGLHIHPMAISPHWDPCHEWSRC